MQRTINPHKCLPWKWVLLALFFLFCERSLAINVGIDFPDIASDSTIVILNSDDDDGNGTPDKDTNGPVANENDLQEINVSVHLGTDYTGSVQIGVVSGGAKIKLWSDALKTGEPLPSPWTVPITNGVLQPEGGKPTKFFVEGIAASAAPNDVEIKVTLPAPQGSQSAHDSVFLTLLPVEVNYVDRDVMTNQWAQKKPFASSTDAALFAGPHSGDMVEWRLPDGIFQDQTISWSAKHIASSEINSGPSGVGVNFWRIANEGGNDLEQDEWLKWKPGEYMISCELDGKTVEIQRVRVGYRSDHILVIGQIVPTFSHDLDKPIGGSAGLWASAVADDITSSILPAAIPLDFHDNVALGMGATFLLLPERGAEAWAACWAGALEFPPGWIPSWWPSAWIPPSVAPPAVPMASAGPAFTSYGGKFRPMGSMTARHHYWATQHMLNTNPDSPTVPTAIFTKAAAGTPSLAQVFADKQYRVFHEFQAKFLLTNQGKIEQSTFVPIHNRAAKGTTKLKVLEVNAGDWGTAYASVGVGLPPISVQLPPLDIKSFPDEDSETNLHNEKISHAAAGDEVSSFATARIGEKGRRVSYRQFGKDAPWIFSEIIFHVESDWKVNLMGRTSTTVQWDLLIKPDQSQSVIVSRSPHAPASTPGISIFNNLNLYARSELDQFILIKDGLLNMEGHLQSFVESGSGAWPEPPIPPTVK